MKESSATSQSQGQITPPVGDHALKQTSSLAVLSSDPPEQSKRGFGIKLKGLIITPFMKYKLRRSLKKEEEELLRRTNAHPEVKALIWHHMTRRECAIFMAWSDMENVASEFAPMQVRLWTYNFLDERDKLSNWGRVQLSWVTRDVYMMERYANNALSYIQELERGLSQVEELILQMQLHKDLHS
ncbi:hypothetical protein SLS56_001476 [Neofusicoccum ribis]|uniref:Uncharacterized protein n=1 Tax=Neofusicoccum ribis TaxID=45134 RepID=A0ABR3T8B5_9PEZI